MTIEDIISFVEEMIEEEEILLERFPNDDYSRGALSAYETLYRYITGKTHDGNDTDA